MIPRRQRRISLPPTIKERLEQNAELHGAVLATIAAFEPWLEDNKLAFFPGYTDHGPDHVHSVLATAAALIPPISWNEVSDADCALLVVSTLLHDCAMHISEDGLAQLLTAAKRPLAGFDGDPWAVEWQRFLSEATRWDGRKLRSVFGDATPISPPSLNPVDMSLRDRLLIGEFVRRHHPRMAHEISLFGVPGPNGPLTVVQGLDDEFRNLAGLVARSHGMPIREAVDHLPRLQRREVRRLHIPYLMALLRIADYIQIDEQRAPGELLKIRGLRSPFSRGEWDAHAAVKDLTLTHDDPEALLVRATPETTATFLKLTSLFSSIQSELDESWSVLGEVYGRIPGLNSLALTIRRIRSNLDDVMTFAQTAPYIPVAARFDTAGADLLKLLIEPLYGDNPEIGIRELLQNAVDAVIEKADLFASRGAEATHRDAHSVIIDVNRKAGNVATLEIEDQGVGMSTATLINYFLKAGASFRNSNQWKTYHTNADGKSRVLRSGRFGIGALATFLLGDSLEVSTCHVDDVVGTQFRAHVDDEVIELRKIIRPPGTTIRIELRPEVAKRLLANAATNWDWYNLATPLVLRRVNLKELSQGKIWPEPGAELPPEWRKITPPDFREVHWSYWSETWLGGFGDSLACNGIRVRDGLPSNELYTGGGKRLSIRMPDVSVFDPNGALPLNLQRSGLQASRYPFQQNLIDSVAQDLLAFIHASAPIDPKDIFGYEPFTIRPRNEPFTYPGLATEEIGPSQIWDWFWCTPQGWCFLDEDMLEGLAPDRLVVTFDKSDAVALRAIDFARDHVIPMRATEGVRDSHAWLRLVMGRPGALVGPLASLQLRGSIVVLPKLWFEEASRGATLARDIFQHSKVEEHDDWVILHNRSIGATNLDIAEIVNERPRGRRSAIAELFVERVSRRGSAPHPLTRVWRKLAPTLAVPYDRLTRSRARPAELDTMFSAHLLLRQERPKLVGRQHSAL